MSKKLFILDHPLAGAALKILRHKDTPSDLFRVQAMRLGRMLALESTRDLPTADEKTITPMCETTEKCVTQSVGIAPILRAGIALVDPFLDFMPDAHVWFLGMYRDEKTFEPVSYYNKLPDNIPNDIVYVVDPMLATGGSAISTVYALKEKGVKKVVFVGLIGAPEGVEALHKEYPDVDIYLGALDEKLNDDKYIVPGLGDAGDRFFNSFE